jgi:hypothetical protein
MTKRPSVLKVLSYLFIKYLTFFLILGFFGDRYKTIILNKPKDSAIVIASAQYLLEILFASFLLMLILFVPLYLLFKLKRTFYVLPAFIALVIAEYFIYEATCSYIHFDIAGIVNAAISIVFFFIFFWKFIFPLQSNPTSE